MNYTKLVYIIGLVMLTLFLFLYSTTQVKAGGPWHDQYCDVEVTKIKVVDAQGNLLENRTEEKLVCEDGVKDFLHGFGIADSCQMFTWFIPLGNEIIEQRSIACHKMDGGYEIVKGYHSGH